MSQSGPNTCGTGADDSTVGTVAWTNVTNITASDNVYATAALGNGVISHYAKATNFGFSIPTIATILGVVAEWEIKSAGVNQSSIKLVKGGTISGNNKSTGASISATEAFVSFGSSSDLWGVALTPADVNGSTFGCVFSAVGATKESSPTVSIDSCRITIYYSLPSGGFFSVMGGG